MLGAHLRSWLLRNQGGGRSGVVQTGSTFTFAHFFFACIFLCMCMVFVSLRVFFFVSFSFLSILFFVDIFVCLFYSLPFFLHDSWLLENLKE